MSRWRNGSPQPVRTLTTSCASQAATAIGVAAGVPNPDYSGEVFLQNNNGNARLARMTPMAIDVEIEAVSEDIVVVNQNYHPGWKAGSYEVVEIEGLLGIKIQKEANL